MNQYKKLMSTSSIQNLKDEEIQDLFDTSIQEVKSLLLVGDTATTATTTNWNTVTKIFKDNSRTRKKDSLLVCPKKTTTQNKQPIVKKKKNKKQVPDDAVYQQDLQERLESLDELFAMRSQQQHHESDSISSVFLLPETKAVVERDVRQLIDTTLQEIVHFANELEQQLKTGSTTGAGGLLLLVVLIYNSLLHWLMLV